VSPNLTLVLISGLLVAAGVYLMLERSLTRILVGVLLASNGVNVLFLVASGAAGGAPIIGVTDPQDMSDPLPQAMVLTAIVITLGVTAYLLALAYRSFQLNGHDEVADDVEDAAIRRLAEADLASDSYDEDVEGHPDEVGQGTADEEGERVPAPDPEADDAPEVGHGDDADPQPDDTAEPDAATDLGASHEPAGETR
jgi:multicomponent Na+:H+ antiporter subunit C